MTYEEAVGVLLEVAAQQAEQIADLIERVESLESQVGLADDATDPAARRELDELRDEVSSHHRRLVTLEDEAEAAGWSL